MGYAYYELEGMERGYGVPDICHAESCNEQIDRGMAYLCYSCLLYYCGQHLTVASNANDDIVKFECFAGESSQCCQQCATNAETDDNA